MARSLVIVESATKAPTINRYLGRDYTVKSSAGHVRDLPVGGRGGDPKALAEARAKEAAKTRKLSPAKRAEYRKKRSRSQLVQRMGVDPENGWKAAYEVIPGKEKVVRELRALAARADRIYLATDLDREGEAIAWHLTEVLGGAPERYQRVVFNEITKSAIERAFANPTAVNQDRVRRPSRRGAFWIASSVSSCRRCCGRKWRAGFPPGACSRWRCGWSSNASAKFAPSIPRSTGKHGRS